MFSPVIRDGVGLANLECSSEIEFVPDKLVGGVFYVMQCIEKDCVAALLKVRPCNAHIA
mgnify:CR=1 FL=1